MSKFLRKEGGDIVKGLRFGVASVAAGTAAYTVTANDSLVQVSTSSGQALTVTLPEAATYIGQLLALTFVTDGGQNVTVNRAGSDTLDENTDTGNTSYTMANAGETITLLAVQDNIWTVVNRVGGTLA